MPESAFDSYAETYDSHFTQSAIGKLQRERVRIFLSKHLKKMPLNILEINCGTGEDAFWMADKGHKVTATDGSEEMIKVCINKKREENSQKIEFLQCPFSELKTKFGE